MTTLPGRVPGTLGRPSSSDALIRLYPDKAAISWSKIDVKNYSKAILQQQIKVQQSHKPTFISAGKVWGDANEPIFDLYQQKRIQTPLKSSDFGRGRCPLMQRSFERWVGNPK